MPVNNFVNNLGVIYPNFKGNNNVIISLDDI
ncbi:MAG: hypothetical protein K0Q79_1758 [Flavipsychrobacter sp.]|jgi:hypothetical protein|nr:hypothetical protein [Flavipsychrobacter sp.]